MNRTIVLLALAVTIVSAVATYAGVVSAPPLPSGRISYRTPAEVNREIALLAERFPHTARRILLPNRSLLGQETWALEISRNVSKSEWKPALLITGLHHGREWPTADLAMEFAWDVLQHAVTDSAVALLLDQARLIVVPVVNPDGLEISQVSQGDRKRKNCRIVYDQMPTRAACADSTNAALGVDINRNYGAFWGGAGAAVGASEVDTRGSAPFSEPETRNVLSLLLTNQVVIAVSSHTREGSVVRMPAALDEPTLPDLPLHDSIAIAFARDLRFKHGSWPDIYQPGNGTFDQTAYYATSTLPFTFELTPGQEYFHPPFRLLAAQYFGRGRYWRSNARIAFYHALQLAANASLHSVLHIRAPAGAILTVAKDIDVMSSRVVGVDGTARASVTIPLHIASRLTVDSAATDFYWHVNPSVRANQQVSGYLSEKWRVSCVRTKNVITRAVLVTRGDTATLNFADCQ